MMTIEEARNIKLDDSYLESCQTKISVVGYDPLQEGKESAVKIRFGHEDGDPAFELNLSLGGKWKMNIDDKNQADKKQIGQFFKTKFFKSLKSDLLKKIADCLDSKSGEFTWIDSNGQVFKSSFEEYQDGIVNAKNALLNPVKYIEKTIAKVDESQIPEELLLKKSIPRLDSFHLNQLPTLLKKIFKDSFEEVKVLMDKNAKIHLTFYVNKPEVRISRAQQENRVLRLVPELKRILDYILRTQNSEVDIENVQAINIPLQREISLCEGEGGGMASGGAAGPAIGAPDASPGNANPNAPISSEDVLGKFDKDKGCMGKGDFHLPCIIPMSSRFGCIQKKRKKGKKRSQKVKVIKNYKDLTEIEMPQSKATLVFNLPHNKIEQILDSTKIDNPRYNKEQFLKYLDADAEIEYVGLFGKTSSECFSMAALAFDRADDEDCYVAEIQSFQRGFGQELLLRIIKSQGRVWLLCNPGEGQKLLEFYRRPVFGLKEHIVQNSIWNHEAHFFYTSECDEQKLLQYINKTYSKEN